ncbi:MAG: hypothetical protein ICV67_06665 [Thermoleophilia bacterium]|nr:hypothetical protein [Thermoleophilia bacterium]
MMNTYEQIHREIDALSERRRELWRELGEGLDPAVASELKQLDERLAQLWEQHRALRAQARFGDRERIIARARAEERLERAA